MKNRKSLSAYEISQLSDALHSCITSLLQSLHPDKTIKQSGNEIRIGDNGAISYDLRKRVYHDHIKDTGGDIFAMIMEVEGCGFGKALKLAQEFVGGSYSYATLPPQAKPKAKTNENRIKARNIIYHCDLLSEPEDSAAEKYLESRGITIARVASNLFSHSALYHPETKKRHPAMVGYFTDVNDKFQAIHRTYLTPEGLKLTGEGVTAKLMLGSSHGCAIRLSAATDTVALTEGIEDALSVMQLYPWPCWATGSAANLAAVVLPDTIHKVFICADNDKAGLAAAQKAALCFIAEGRKVQIVIPPNGHKDFNAYLMTKKATA